jgi:transcriptional regulator with XRE-family HTH domain
MSVGVKIRQLRDKKGLTQPELAARLGISQAALCNIESGDTKKVDFLLMDRICKEFKVDFDYFTEDKQVNHINKNKRNCSL